MIQENSAVRPFQGETHPLGANLLAEVDRKGYLVLTNTGFCDPSLDECHRRFHEFCAGLGKPLPHNEDPTSIVWPIKPVPGVNRAFNTHSELSALAELHTDSAFSEAPDDYFCLYSVKAARCGGGKTLLLSAEDFCEELMSTQDGREAEAIFRSEPFPFAVPSAFQETEGLAPAYVKALVLEGSNIRFRADVIERAAADHPGSLSERQRAALKVAKHVCEASKHLKHLTLTADSVIIINNKTMLHGRTAFTDVERHLLRVRLHRP